MRENEQFQTTLNAVLDALAEIRSEIRDLRDNGVQRHELLELQNKLERFEQRLGDENAELFGSDTGAPVEPPARPILGAETRQTHKTSPQQEETDQALVKPTEPPTMEPKPSEDTHITGEQLQETVAKLGDEEGVTQLTPTEIPEADDLIAQIALQEEIEDARATDEHETTTDIPFKVEPPPIAAIMEERLITAPEPPEPAEPPPPKPPSRQWNWADIESLAAVWKTRIGVFIIVVGLGYGLSLGIAQ